MPDFVGVRDKYLYDDFGDPLNVTDMGEGYYAYEYDGVSFIYDAGIDCVVNNSFAPSTLTVNGVALDKTQDELLEIFGNPDEEETGWLHYDDWNGHKISIKFVMISSTATPSEIFVRQS
jgi:hypothetical protein